MIVFKNTIFLAIYKNCSDFDFFVIINLNKMCDNVSLIV